MGAGGNLCEELGVAVSIHFPKPANVLYQPRLVRCSGQYDIRYDP